MPISTPPNAPRSKMSRTCSNPVVFKRSASSMMIRRVGSGVAWRWWAYAVAICPSGVATGAGVTMGTPTTRRPRRTVAQADRAVPLARLTKFGKTPVFLGDHEESLSSCSCQRHELPSHSPVTNVHHGRYFLELLFRILRTITGVRQQYRAVFLPMPVES